MVLVNSNHLWKTEDSMCTFERESGCNPAPEPLHLFGTCNRKCEFLNLLVLVITQVICGMYNLLMDLDK
jgi:hypothetical protein